MSNECICGHTLNQHEAPHFDPIQNIECRQPECPCVAFRERRNTEPIDYRELCPNCGEHASFREHSADCVETHGLDCGPYEGWTETWLTCSECGAKTDADELQAMNVEVTA